MNENFEKARELKDLLNLREKENLRSLACFSHTAVRRHKEPFNENEYRQAFSADSDRILNSLAYTRYIDKTQVFSLVNNDHLTHRIIHVQLVSRVARTIGRYLGLNEDLIEAASLGHDIGHTPFGHDGERFLSKLTHEHGAGFFHHNLQSIQFLDKIEKNGNGWNLSLQTMDAIICHNGEVHSIKLTPQKKRSFEELDLMIEEIKTKKICNEIPMTMEGCVVRMADTISYIGRDLEDAIRMSMVRREDVPDLCRKRLGQTNGTIVFNLVTDLITNSLNQGYIAFSDDISEALKEMKAFNYKHIYKNPVIKRHLSSIEDIFCFLFETYMADLEKGNETSVIFSDFLNGMAEKYTQTHSYPEIVRDYISGMTDSYFIRQAPDYLKPDSMFENRTYRKQHKKNGLVSFDVTVKETNLNIQAESDLSREAIKSVLNCRNYIETYIKLNPEFATSLIPVQELSPSPKIISDMINAARLANVGPMASVAGTVAEYTGKALLNFSSEVLVENGGDIFVKSKTETIFSIYAENSPFNLTTGILVGKKNESYGMCTSSGTLGHSKSFGKADAATVLSDSCPLADAVATRLGNMVNTPKDIKTAIDKGKAIPGVQGIVIIKGENIGLWGDLKLVKL